MDFAVLPPEVNSGRMYAGPGATPLLAASASWQALAAELEVGAAGYSEVISALIGMAWSGSASVAMAAAVAPYVAWMQGSSAKAEQAAMQANVVATAFEAAYAATVPPAVIAANRATLAALVATNFLGQNTPAIAANEAQYAEMWAQDAVAMYGYAAAALPASELRPFDQPPQTADPAGLGAQSAAVGRAAASAAADAPTWPPAWYTQFLQLFGPFTQLTSAEASMLSGDSSLYTVVSNGASWGRLNFVRGGVGGALTFEGLGPRAVLTTITTPTTVGPGMGRAMPIGGLSVPPGWASAAPEMRATAVTLAAAQAPPSGAVGLQPGVAFQESMMGTTAGQGATANAAETRRDKKSGDKKEDDAGKPISTLTSGGGWLAASWAYHVRPRDPRPLPTHWRTG
ncbi:PPE family protein [Mycolicibacter minnesotensis]